MLIHTIRVKRLDLESPQRASSAMANFDRLAWFNTKAGQVFNAGNPFTAHTINAKPFEQNRILDPGVHLHFILPQALTRFSKMPEDVLQAPDRWLVRKIRSSKTAGTWVIESDFLSTEPQFYDKTQSTTLLPVDTITGNSQNSQPFRYMGRILPLEEYLAMQKTPEQTYWKDLLPTPFTAFAHGDVHFSSFYPNCSSVFGFHDPEGLSSDSYEITGWYETNRNGITPEYLLKINEFLQKKPSAKELETQWGVQLSDEFVAYLDKADVKMFPELIFYGKATQQDKAINLQAEGLTPILGNGSDEAFSTFLAHKAGDSETEKIRLERELEALHFGHLKQQTLDLAPDFESGRHRKGFISELGMSLFDLTLAKNDYSEEGKQENATMDYPVHLPGFIQLREEIESINKLIKQQEKNELEIAGKRQLLFSHWQKYLQSTHPPLMIGEQLPDSNRILSFIAEQVIPDLRGRMQQSGRLKSAQHSESPVGGDSPVSVTIMLHTAEMGTSVNNLFWQYTANQFEPLEGLPAEATHAANIVTKLAEIKKLIDDLNTTVDLLDNSIRLVLQHRRGQTYYTPIQPTLMLAGESLKQLIPNNDASNPTTPLSFSDTYTGINNFLNDLATGHVTANKSLFNLDSGIRELSVPLFLDWEAYFFPIEKIGSQHEEYYRNFISDCFEIPQEDAEFSLKQNTEIKFSDSVSRYVGRTIPVTTAGKNIRDKINNLPDDLRTKIPSKVVGALNDNGFLIQALDGLNTAFLQEKILMQLPITDPIAFSPYTEIFQRLDLSRFIGENRLLSPEPEFDFSPIRSGGIHLSAIELINTFGITTRISPKSGDLLVPETMRPIDRKSLQQASYLPDVHAFFYPRFIQETALASYWLNAESNRPIYTEATNANPICGWVVPNFMTKSLAMYTTDGEHLCNILEANKIIRFEQGPKRDFFDIDQVENKYLRQVMTYLGELPSMNDFLALLQESLFFIDPENAPNHNELNYMFGRPLALVRMQISFETKGTYASRKDHYAFRNMLASRNPEPLTAKYESVNIPLQIGDYTKLNEGVVLYWSDSDKKEVLYSSSISPSEQLQTNYSLPEVKPKINHAIKDAPIKLTLLIDPRAEAHICSGVVPINVMKLDEQFWKSTLQRLRIDFDMGPGLFPRGEIRLNLPNSSDYGWAWLQKHLSTDKEPFFSLTPQLPAIRKKIFEREKRSFETLKEITWEQLEYQEILMTVSGGDPSHAFVKFENCQPGATSFNDETTKELLSFFDTFCTRISPVETSAEFKPNEFHDGWLELYDASYLNSDKNR